MKLFNMSKQASFLAIIALSCISLISCKDHVLHGEGNKVTKNVPLATFNSVEISVSSVANINVQPGAQPGIEMFGYGNHLEHVVTRVENGKLIIEDNLKPRWTFGNRKEIEFKITVPSLEDLSLDGSSEANIHGNLTGKSFKIDISGAVKLVVDSMNVTDFSSDMSGAANIEINGGAAQTAYYEISGAAKVKAFALKTTETKTSISGAAKAEVNATDKLDIDISGAGKVKYKGHPTITKDISGAASIIDAN